MDGEYQVSTDKKEKIKLDSEIVEASWLSTAAHGGLDAQVKVVTYAVAEGSSIEIKGFSSKGKAPGTIKGKIYNNEFIGSLPIPEKVELGAQIGFEAKLPKHGLKTDSLSTIPVGPPIKISKMCWDKNEVRRGDVVTLSVQFVNPLAGTEAKVVVYEYDPDGHHEAYCSFPVEIQNDKIDVNWEFDYTGDAESIVTEEERQKHHKHYVPVQYFFIVIIDGVRIGEKQESGFLKFKDDLNLDLTNFNDFDQINIPYTLQFADGSQRQGTIDSSGVISELDIPPGPVQLAFNVEQDPSPALEVSDAYKIVNAPDDLDAIYEQSNTDREKNGRQLRNDMIHSANLEFAFKGNKSYYLREGDSGEGVGKVQNTLLEDDSTVLPVYKTDRDFGQETRSAVVNFQKKYNHAQAPILQEGSVGPQTLSILDVLMVRNSIVQEMKNKSIDFGGTTTVDPIFWKTINPLICVLREGMLPWKAVYSIFYHSPCILECYMALLAVYLKGILETLGKDVFSEYFKWQSVLNPGLILSKSLACPRLESLIDEVTVADTSELKKGDWLYYKNDERYGAKHPKGAWAGENVIYIGKEAGVDKYIGHGILGTLSENDLFEKMKTNFDEPSADPASDPALATATTFRQIPGQQYGVIGFNWNQVRRIHLGKLALVKRNSGVAVF